MRTEVRECTCNDSCGHYAELVDMKQAVYKFRELARTKRMLLERREVEVTRVKEKQGALLRELKAADKEVRRNQTLAQELLRELTEHKTRVKQLKEVNDAMMVKMGRMELRYETEKQEVMIVIEGRERDFHKRRLADMHLIAMQQKYIDTVETLLTPAQKIGLDRLTSEWSFDPRSRHPK